IRDRLVTGVQTCALPISMPVRCLENRVFAITSNRTGSEARGGKEQLTFIGNSEVVTPRGAILHRAPGDQEELYIVEIDPADARKIGRASCRERVEKSEAG